MERSRQSKGMRSIKTLEEIPQFDNEAAEAAYWATHSLAEIWDQLEPVRVKVSPPGAADRPAPFAEEAGDPAAGGAADPERKVACPRQEPELSGAHPELDRRGYRARGGRPPASLTRPTSSHRRRIRERKSRATTTLRS